MRYPAPLQSQCFCEVVTGFFGVQTVKMLSQTRDLLYLFQVKIEGKKKPQNIWRSNLVTASFHFHLFELYHRTTYVHRAAISGLTASSNNKVVHCKDITLASTRARTRMCAHARACLRLYKCV